MKIGASHVKPIYPIRTLFELPLAEGSEFLLQPIKSKTAKMAVTLVAQRLQTFRPLAAAR